MYVVKHGTFPGDCFEHSYQEGEIRVTKGVAVVSKVETKDYLFQLGYNLIGEIDHPDQLEALLAGTLKKEEPAGLQVSPVLNAELEKTLGLPENQQPANDYWWQH